MTPNNCRCEQRGLNPYQAFIPTRVVDQILVAVVHAKTTRFAIAMLLLLLNLLSIVVEGMSVFISRAATTIAVTVLRQ